MIATGNRICAWCGKCIGTACTEQDTHGICDECMKREMEAIGFSWCEHCRDWRRGVEKLGHYRLCPDCRAEAIDDAKRMVT